MRDDNPRRSFGICDAVHLLPRRLGTGEERIAEMTTTIRGNYVNRERYDKRIIAHQDRVENAKIFNPLIAEQIEDVATEIRFHNQFAHDAFPVMSFEEWNYKRIYVNPWFPILHRLEKALLCRHQDKDVVDNGDSLYCRKCGAENYGLGWKLNFQRPNKS